MKTNLILRTFFLTIILSGIAYSVSSQKLEEQLDAMIQSQYKPDEPGAVVLIAKEGKVIYRKAFGMANLELDISMKPEMVFEIGSITKQFTAVSILMLMEQGKLNLDDEITKYIEDYPVHGHKITVHHLLTHTSGIKSYTGMEEWPQVWRKDFTPTELIDYFKNQPMDFAPGEDYAYNNSAYFILGYIIEEVSAKSYADFLNDNIFKPLGMTNSYYGSNSKIIKNRASGYQNRDGFINADYLSMTQPYSAGSIMSTVDDLFKWNQAIKTNQLVTRESIDKAFTNYTLNDGSYINYGYGWGINEINGSPTIEHSGGIFGYTTNGIYLPEEDVFVSMFSNRDDIGPQRISLESAAIVIGKPFKDIKDSITMEEEALKVLTGVYDFDDSTSRNILFEEGKLFYQASGGVKTRIIPYEENKFLIMNSLAEIEFMVNENGVQEALFKNRITKTKGVKTDKPIPTRIEIELDAEVMKQYVGEYEIQPGFSINIMLENNHLMAQATGQQKAEIFPESTTKFFYKVVDAQIEFIRNDNGDVDTLFIFQGGQKFKGIKK